MTTTNNLNLNLVQQNQAQKEVTVNEALIAIDALINIGAENIGQITPPSSPNDGEIYIIGSLANNDWLGQDNKIAWFYGNWRFIAPKEGISLWVKDKDKFYYYDGTMWQDKINNISSLGINTDADYTNKLSVNSEAILFNNDGNSSQIKINKNSSSDTASHIFQNNFIGNAEFGLIEDDNFQLKVSSDGSNFYQSFVVDKNSGEINFKQNINIEGNLISDSVLKNYSKNTIIANSGSNYNIDLNLANIFEITLTDNCTINFINAPSNFSTSFKLILKQDATGGRIASFTNNIKYENGNSPTLSTSANKIDILEFINIDGGVNWYGNINGLDFS